MYGVCVYIAMSMCSPQIHSDTVIVKFSELLLTVLLLSVQCVCLEEKNLYTVINNSS